MVFIHFMLCFPHLYVKDERIYSIVHIQKHKKSLYIFHLRFICLLCVAIELAPYCVIPHPASPFDVAPYLPAHRI